MTENEKITKDILNLFPCALGDECQGIEYCKHCQQDKKLVLDALYTKDLKNKSLEDELSTLRKEKEVAVKVLEEAEEHLTDYMETNKENADESPLVIRLRETISILRKDWL